MDRGIAETRSMAQAMIMAGEVRYKTSKLTKPGQVFDTEIELEIAERPRYVSRGGDKLASVAKEIGINFKDAVVLDVGSSTGGFTDYALQNGAKKVYAVDVGTNQLAYKLRNDDRIVVMEQIDIRDIDGHLLDPTPNIAVIDVSFISLTKILEAVAKLITDDGQIVAMAKPQFETDKPTADKYKGVIKDEKLRAQILVDFESKIEDNFEIFAKKDSDVRGAQGNRERFYLLRPISLRQK